MRLVQGDITKMEVDAIVNAATSDLKPCEGICRAVFAAADTEKLTRACKKIGHCTIGSAVVTAGCGLPCRYIIHVAGPIWYSGHANDRRLFCDCYRHALQKAYAYHCKSVAIPLMFSGSLHIPRPEALRMVMDVIRQFEASGLKMEIDLVLYKQSIYELAQHIAESSRQPKQKHWLFHRKHSDRIENN